MAYFSWVLYLNGVDALSERDFCSLRLPRHRHLVLHLLRGLPFSQPFIVSTTGIRSTISSSPMRFAFMIIVNRLFHVNTCNVRTSRRIATGTITFAMIRDSSVYMVVILRVLTIRFRCLLIQTRSMNSFASSFSMDNNCKFCPFHNFALLSK